MTTATKQSSKISSKSSEKIQVLELVRRQGIYTATLEIDSVEEVENILAKFDKEEGTIARPGSRVTEIEFEAKGGRTGKRSYCLRLPKIKIEDLEKAGFKKDSKVNLYIK